MEATLGFTWRLPRVPARFSSINKTLREPNIGEAYARLTNFLCVVPPVPDGKCQDHPEIVLLISSSAMPLFPPDPPSPTWNSEAEPPEPPEPLESDDGDGNERFHGKMTNKISDAPALRSKCVLTLTPLLPPPRAGRRTSSVSTPRRSRSCHPAFSSRER